MSRIGKKPITVPDKVQVTFNGHHMVAKGPKGQLELTLPSEIAVKFENNVIEFSRESDLKHIRAKHGLARSLAFNIVEGVTNGFSKTLLIEGVGFKAEQKDKNLLLSLGFSHPIIIMPPDGIELTAAAANKIIISGIDKQLVGQMAAVIRKLRPPEPYKGKGIRYEGEYVRRKAGKTAA